MILDVEFKESNQTMQCDFGECHEVTDGGYERGFEDGAQVEYDRFWNAYQENGARTDYTRAFTRGWSDANFNPKYKMCPTSAKDMFVTPCQITTILPSQLDTSQLTNINGMFYNNSAITTIPPFDLVNCTSVTTTFYAARAINGIVLNNLRSDCTFSNTFISCVALTDFTVDGIIGTSINVSWSPKLSVESMKNIISHLENYKGTDNELVYTLKFVGDCWTALEADSTAPDGGTWKEYVQLTLGWNV